MSLPKLILLYPKRSRLNQGHVWAYKSELKGYEDLPAGTLVDVVEPTGRFVARGYANPNSEIVFRKLSHRSELIDVDFFKNKIKAALTLRKSLDLFQKPCRLLHAEADGLPGFIVDFYPPVLVVSSTTAGADCLLPLFLEALSSFFKDYPIYERSDNPARKKEGLSERVRMVFGTLPDPFICDLDGLSVRVDLKQGQKTGLYLDARGLRRDLKTRAKNRTVLDCFANTGLFSRYALAGGAKSVTVVETDERALAVIKRDIPEAQIIGENVFDVLRKFQKEKNNSFDCIVLDPPAFTKDSRSVEGALRGYKEINLRALQMLPKGGLLYTSSCSHHVGKDLFLEVITEAVIDSKRSVRLLKTFMQEGDHPILLSIPETEYFKGFLLEVVE